MAVPGLILPPGLIGPQKDIFPELVGVSYANGSSTSSLTVPSPAGTQVGDLLLVIGTFNSGNARTITNNGGWSEQFNIVGPGSIRRVFSYCAVAAANGTGNSVTLTFSGTGVPTAYMLSIRRYSQNYFAYAASFPLSLNPTPPTLTPPWGATRPTLWITFAALENTNWGFASGFSGWWNSGVLNPAHATGSPMRFAVLADKVGSKTPPSVTINDLYGYGAAVSVLTTQAVPGGYV